MYPDTRNTARSQLHQGLSNRWPTPTPYLEPHAHKLTHLNATRLLITADTQLQNFWLGKVSVQQIPFSFTRS